MSRASYLLVLALAAFGPRAAPAQRPTSPRAESFWFGIGLGTTWLRVSCSICRSDRGTGISAYMAIGGSAGRRTLVGAEANGRLKRDGAVHERLWTFQAVTYFRPNARKRLFWKAGAGVSLYRIDDGQDVLTANPLGVQLGVGWDPPLSGGASLRIVPSVTLQVASFGGGIQFNGASAVGHAALTSLQVAFGVMRR